MKKYSRRAIIRGGLAASGALVLASCEPSSQPSATTAPNTTAAGPQTGGELVIGIAGQPENVDPLAPGNGFINARPIIANMFEPLLNYDQNYEPTPGLAKSWDVSRDSLTYTFRLQDGVKWHDGKPFTADDVVYTLTKLPAFIGSLARNWSTAIQDVSSPDSQTVVVKLKSPNPAYLRYIGAYALQGILPKHLYQGLSDQDLRNPDKRPLVGTGPFVFDVKVAGSHVRLRKNPDYWRADSGGRKLPHLDAVIYRVIPDPSSMVLALQKREVDWIQIDVPYASFGTFKGAPGYQSGIFNGFRGYDMFHINHKAGGPLSKVEVRRALMHATDKEAILRTVRLGIGEIVESPVPPNWTPYYDATAKGKYPFDQNRARRMLDEAGYRVASDGTRFSVTVVAATHIPWQISITELLRDQWAAVGVGVKLVTLDNVAHQARVSAGDFDVAAFQNSTSPDPGRIRDFYHSTATGNAILNPGKYTNPALDRLLDAQASELDPRARIEIFRQIQQVGADELPAFWFFTINHLWAASDAVHGVTNGDNYAQGPTLGNSVAEMWLARSR